MHQVLIKNITSLFLYLIILISLIFYILYPHSCFKKCGLNPYTRTLFFICNYFSAIKGLFYFLQFFHAIFGNRKKGLCYIAKVKKVLL